jgi:PPOX class probable F420-dependent enzyme
MTKRLGSAEEAFLTMARVAHLATADASGEPSVVPVCFVLVDDVIYSALDEKPKTVSWDRLKRVRNLAARSRVSLVVDTYDEDWTRLAYVHVRGDASLVQPGKPEHERAVGRLREKYPQYRAMAIETRPVLRIALVAARSWSGGLTRSER